MTTIPVRTPFLPPLALAFVYALAAGLLVGGFDPIAVAVTTGAAFVGTVVAWLLGYGAGRLASRDPDKGWALSVGAAQALLVIVVLVTLLVHPGVGALAPLALVSGWLAARGSPHASDPPFLATVGLVALAVAWRAEGWDESPLFLLPAVLVGVALLAREAWDVALLRSVIEEQRRAPAAGGDVPGPSARPAATRAMLSALAVALGGIGLAWLMGLSREGVRQAYATLGSGSVRNLSLLAFVAALAGVVLLLARSRKPQPVPPPRARI